jgi:integrase/recombinase XerD
MAQAKTISDEEFMRLLRTLEKTRSSRRNKTMIYMTHWAGLRVGEVASLKLKDVANRDGSIKSEIRLSSQQTKGNQSRVVILPSKLKEELERYVATRWKHAMDEPLFASSKTQSAFTSNSLGNLIKSFYVKAGIDNGSSHSGRRTFITQLAQKGVSARVLQSLAGHRHLGTTQRYIDINDEMRLRAVELI